mgnify:CR=1 FL=1
MNSMLIQDVLVVTPAAEPIRRDILIEDGIIAAIALPGTLNAEAATCLEASDLIAIPGLVNAHTHGHANLAKGSADRWLLEASLVNGAWMGGGRDAETAYLSTLIGAIDMISKGTTSCFDLVYGFPLPDPIQFAAVAQAYADAGMRAVLAPMVADRTLFDSVPGLRARLGEHLDDAGETKAPDADAILSALDAILALPLPQGISRGLAPTIPHQCSDALITGCSDLARRHGLPLHMHIAESRPQVEIAHDVYGRSPVAHLDTLGVLGDHFVAAHAIWLDASDLDMLGQSGACMVHIPASNLRLGSGAAHIRPALERNITVALATDGANSSDALNMFEAMRLASGISRLFGSPRADWLDKSEPFAMATAGGARVLGYADTGSLAPGMAADLVLLDGTSIAFTPLNDPLNQIVTAENGSSVTHVMVGGRLVVKDGKPTGVDLSEVRARLAAVWPAYHARIAAQKHRSLSLEPVVIDFVQSRKGAQLSFERFIAGEASR